MADDVRVKVLFLLIKAERAERSTATKAFAKDVRTVLELGEMFDGFEMLLATAGPYGRQLAQAVAELRAFAKFLNDQGE